MKKYFIRVLRNLAKFCKIDFIESFVMQLQSIYEKNSVKEAFNEVDSKLIYMLIVAEDHRFFNHTGVDFIAIARAFCKTIFFKKIEGGSTIEQQLVRTITRRYQRTIRRKFIEIILAITVDQVVPKNRVPALYLNLAYFGHAMAGYKKAAKKLRYNLNSLSDEEAAGLVARLKYPEPSKFYSNRASQIDLRTKFILSKYYVLKDVNYNDREIACV